MEKKDALKKLRDVEYQLRCILQKDCSFNGIEWMHLYNVVDSLSTEILRIEKDVYEVNEDEFNEI